MRAAELLRWGQDETVRNAAVLDLIAAPTACAASTSTSRQPISKQILTSIYRQLNAKDESPYVYVENERNDHFLYGLVAPLLARILAVSCPGLLCVVQLPKTDLNTLKRKGGAVKTPPTPSAKRKRTFLRSASSGEGQKGSRTPESSPQSKYDHEKAEKLSMNGTIVTRSEEGAVPVRDVSNTSSDFPLEESPNITKSSMLEKDKTEERRASSESATESLEEMSMKTTPSRVSDSEDNAVLHLVCNGFDVLTGKVPQTNRCSRRFSLATTGWVQAGVVSPENGERGVTMRFSNKKTILTEGVVVTYLNGSMVLLTIRDPVQALRSLLIANDTPTVLFAFSVLNQGSLEQYFASTRGQKATSSQLGGSQGTQQILMRNNIFVVEIGHKGNDQPNVGVSCEPKVQESQCQKKSSQSSSPVVGAIADGSGNGSGSGSDTLESLPEKEILDNEKDSFRLVPMKQESEPRKNEPVAQGAPWTQPVTTDKVPNAVPLFVNTLVTPSSLTGREVENMKVSDCDRSTSETTGRRKRPPLKPGNGPRRELYEGSPQSSSHLQSEKEDENTKNKKEPKKKQARKRASQRRKKDDNELKLNANTGSLEYGAHPGMSQECRTPNCSLLCAPPQILSNSNLTSLASTQTRVTTSQKNVGPYRGHIPPSSSSQGSLPPYQHPSAHVPLPPQHARTADVTYAYDNVHSVPHTVVGPSHYLNAQGNLYKPCYPIGYGYHQQHDRPVVVYPSQVGFLPVPHDPVFQRMPNSMHPMHQPPTNEYRGVPQVSHSQYAGHAGGPSCTAEPYGPPPPYRYPVVQVSNNLVRRSSESNGALETLMQMGEGRSGKSTTAMEHVYSICDAPAISSSVTPSLRTRETGGTSRADSRDAGASNTMSNASSRRRT